MKARKIDYTSTFLIADTEKKLRKLLHKLGNKSEMKVLNINSLYSRHGKETKETLTEVKK